MSSESYSILVLLALLAIFYIAVLRPARRAQQATAKVQGDLSVGDRVVLSAGIFGVIRELEEARVMLEIAPGTIVEVARQVVVRRVEDLPEHLVTDADADPRDDGAPEPAEPAPVADSGHKES